MKNRFLFIVIVIAFALTISGCGKKDRAEVEETPVNVVATADVESAGEPTAIGYAVDMEIKGEGTASTDADATEGFYAEAEYKADYEADYSRVALDDASVEMYDMTTKDDLLVDGSGMIKDSAVLPEASLLIEEPIAIDPVIEEPYSPQPTYGLLTAGEWNDNEHYEFLKNLLANGQQDDYSRFFKTWKITPFNRIVVHVSQEAAGVDGGVAGKAIFNAKVCAVDSQGREMWTARTDNKGMAYIFYSLFDEAQIPSSIRLYIDDEVVTEHMIGSEDLLDDHVIELIVPGATVSKEKKLDLMFVIDTTGSMGDEISYLQKELEDVITRVEYENSNIPVRLSVNFYRDIEDDYIVRSNEFSSDINQQLMYLAAEHADGGGDYPEAVETALENAVNGHMWDDDSVKLMFIVLDAPPHNTSDICTQLASTITDATAKGIRIIPVASSGVDKDTEFLLRALAMVSGGTYTFLTDDSGIGESHIEPTVGEYEVEHLNDMLVRIIGDYLKESVSTPVVVNNDVDF